MEKEKRAENYSVSESMAAYLDSIHELNCIMGKLLATVEAKYPGNEALLDEVAAADKPLRDMIHKLIAYQVDERIALVMLDDQAKRMI